MRLSLPDRALLLGSLVLGAALLPLAAEAQVLDTTRTNADSTDYAIETYFVQTDSVSFFEPHEDEDAVRRLLERSRRGQCRTLTLVRAARQRNAAAVGRRHGGEAINVRLILRCGRSASMPTRARGLFPSPMKRTRRSER